MKKAITIILALALSMSLAVPAIASNAGPSGPLGRERTMDDFFSVSNLVSKSAFSFESSAEFPFEASEMYHATAPATLTVTGTGGDSGLLINIFKITNLTSNSFERIDGVPLATGEYLDGDGEDLSALGYTVGSTFVLEPGMYSVYLWMWGMGAFIEVTASGASQAPPPVTPTPSTPTPPVTPPPAANDIKVLVNGTAVSFDQPPIIQNGRTLVPLRAIFEALGAKVDYEQSTQTLTAVRENVTVIMQIGNSVFTVNGNQKTLDVAPQIIGGRTLVPARAIAESFGAEVGWDAATQTMTISMGAQQQQQQQQSAEVFEFIGTLAYFGPVALEDISHSYQTEQIVTVNGVTVSLFEYTMLFVVEFLDFKIPAPQESQESWTDDDWDNFWDKLDKEIADNLGEFLDKRMKVTAEVVEVSEHRPADMRILTVEIIEP